MSQICNNLKRNLPKSFCLVLGFFSNVLCKPKRMINTSSGLDGLSHPNRQIFQSTLVPIIVLKFLVFCFGLLCSMPKGKKKNYVRHYPKQKYRAASFWPSFIGYNTSSTLGKRKKKMGALCVHFELSHWLHEKSISKTYCHHI